MITFKTIKSYVNKLITKIEPKKSIPKESKTNSKYEISPEEDIFEISTDKLVPKVSDLVAKNLSESEKIIATYPFLQYKKEGLPLKYPRKEFVNDILKTLDGVSPYEAKKLLNKFDIKLGHYDIDSVPKANVANLETQKEKELAALIDKFYHNEVTISDPKIKKELDSIISEFPEFTIMIGKQQHGIHAYSVDIHTLENLRKIINSKIYESLDPESKKIAKIVTLFHDVGKAGYVESNGHAFYSKIYMKAILAKHNEISEESKERILNLIANHHWFAGYNQGYLKVEDFKKIFTSEADRKIAMIFAKADLSSVSKNFHLAIMGTKTQKEFDTKIDNILEALQQQTKE